MSIVEYIATAAASLPSIDASTQIYKDECMYSFDTAENNNLGLDVCMCCFQAFSRTPHKNYTLEHYTLKRHPLFVNITKTLKSQPEPERSSKVAKLEIVEQKESDIYDLEYQVYVAPRDESVAIAQTSDRVQKLAYDLINANSASVNDDIKAWEQEVFPCEHSLHIDAVASDRPDLTQCASCDLKENLWICLSCGTVACGREQFGSAMKGNSHALAHASSSEHHVAVKLGSLSADNEDSCDCYCYKCNDEVKVPDLAQKLLPFGVDLTAAVKSEKSLVEMNLDTNKSWQFNLDGEDGEKLSPLFGPGLTGMQNLGNSCYLNSVLQALFSFPEYQNFYKELDFDKSVANAAVHLKSQMLKLYDGLWSGRYSKPNSLKGDDYQMGIRPSTFKNLIGADHPEFKTNRQQDANEFLLYLFDKLDKEYGLSLNESFKFLLGTKVMCTKCHTGSNTVSLVDNISVPIACDVIEEQDGVKSYRPVQLQDSFVSFSTQEVIENYQCNSCGETSTATKQEGFKSFPQNLIVSVQRIALENWVPVKREVPIEVPDQINLGAYCAPDFAGGETETKIRDESESPAFVPNEEAMSMLVSMGFSESRCMRGLYNTGNSNAGDAMNWIFAHMDDDDIDSPFEPTSKKPSAEPSPEAVNDLLAMGFSENLAKKALVVNKGNMNAAVEWLFSNPDDDGVIPDGEPVVDLEEENKKLKAKLLDVQQSSADYELKAVICHKGSSPHTGHYVVFIKERGKWVLFNDEKIVSCGAATDDMRKNGYIYFFQKH